MALFQQLNHGLQQNGGVVLIPHQKDNLRIFGQIPVNMAGDEIGVHKLLASFRRGMIAAVRGGKASAETNENDPDITPKNHYAIVAYGWR